MDTYNPNATKRTIELHVNGDLLDMAMNMGINLSGVLEQSIAKAIEKRQSELWLVDNESPVGIYNEFVDDNGVFSDSVRRF